ncbi:4Fe-4S dicluster domain-containing protein [bacterium]|nr:4Fe-4S dicluster domain-containing protein [bacterium]
MPISLDPTLSKEIKTYGGDEISTCINCGNCSATCSLVNEHSVFPRNTIRNLQIGRRDKLRSSLEPWLCYYCGECTENCPRTAYPGELMMAARRWLIAQYDWTGLSTLMYRSPVFEFFMLLVVALLTAALFLVPSNFGFHTLAGNHQALQTVRLDIFAPRHIVHWGDVVLAVILSVFLLSNAARMVYFNMRSYRVPGSAWLKPITDFVVHGLTQKRWRDCDSQDSNLLWLRHILLVSGYGTMFMLVMVFLNPFQVEDTAWHWTSLFGYYATLALMGASITILTDRMSKRTQMHHHSHFSDWLFPILLFLTALTGIVMHALRLMDLPLATYVAFVVHLAIAVPMLVVEVPFGKWAHLLYRPIAHYLHEVKLHAE